jgi:uncharacterized protein YgbK (DUF1537 family)
VWTRVVADDLTGACDVGAALHGIGVPIVVESLGAPHPTRAGDAALVVRNTQSRTLPPAAAAVRVRRALEDAPHARDGVVVKKIDTALRGPLGAEIDAAMDAVRARLAIVLPAIPEVGRTTVAGRQLHDGVPVHETAFARDPHNPIDESRVAAVIAATARRRVGEVALDDVRSGRIATAIARRTREGGIVVGDAESDADLERWIAALPLAAAPLVLVGSTALARACRALPFRWPSRGAALRASADRAGAGTGVLVVSGSAHPSARAQLDHVAASADVTIATVDVGAPGASAETAAHGLAAGGIVVLAAPVGRVAGGSARVVEALGAATAATFARVRPRSLVLVGGETAFSVLAALGHPRLLIDRAPPMPLVACATILDGTAAGTAVVTKGGSTGGADRLSALVREAAR